MKIRWTAERRKIERERAAGFRKRNPTLPREERTTAPRLDQALLMLQYFGFLNEMRALDHHYGLSEPAVGG